jgi:hypothetical protein
MTILKGLVLSIIALIAPLQTTVLATLALSGIDLLTGLLASKKQGSPITSSGLKRTAVKGVIYPLAILLAHVTALFLVGQDIPLVKIVAGYIGLVELKSSLENMDIILGGSTFKVLIDRLQNMASGGKEQ